jgi:hypothetical protein
VASDSAGLRVRLHPSLQSEQIGVITLGAIISFTSEVGMSGLGFVFSFV